MRSIEVGFTCFYCGSKKVGCYKGNQWIPDWCSCTECGTTDVVEKFKDKETGESNDKATEKRTET